MRVEIYENASTPGPDRFAGAFELTDGKIEVRAASQKDWRLLQSILNDPAYGKGGKQFTSWDDPKGWLKALPIQYGRNCTMVKAVAVKKPIPILHTT